MEEKIKVHGKLTIEIGDKTHEIVFNQIQRDLLYRIMTGIHSTGPPPPTLISAGDGYVPGDYDGDLTSEKYTAPIISTDEGITPTGRFVQFYGTYTNFTGFTITVDSLVLACAGAVGSRLVYGAVKAPYYSTAYQLDLLDTEEARLLWEIFFDYHDEVV